MNNLETLLNKFSKEISEAFNVSRGQGKKILMQLVGMNDIDVTSFIDTLKTIKDNITNCPKCNAMIVKNEKCPFENKDRNKDLVCIVSSNEVLFNLERNRIYDGIYFVLEKEISDVNEELDVESLEQLITEFNSKEMIIATTPSFTGEMTAVYLTEKFSHSLKITRLGVGVSFNSNLDYVNPDTLKYAFINRKERNDE